MRIDIHLHTGEGEHSLLTQILAGIHKLQLGQGTIMATQAEQTAQLDAIGDGLTEVSAQLTKAADEITAEVQGLKDQIATAGNSTPAMDAAFARITDKLTAVKGVAQALDDLNPDAAPPPAP